MRPEKLKYEDFPVLSPLLKTKLIIPPTRAELVQRKQLIQALQKGTEGKLTLISAPAGYGKTTLLSSWVKGCGLRASWLTLDEGDNDPARFLAYFSAAIRSAIGNGEKSTSNPPHIRMQAMSEEALIEIINWVLATERRFVLIMDDYHVIFSQAIHEALSFVLDHLPIQMHLVIATRSELPLPLGLLRGKGELVELHQSDLRFDNDEAREFLNRIMGLDLSMQNVTSLAQRTEGWAVGLQMAALALQSNISTGGRLENSEASAWAQDFSGSHRFVMEYLVEEVLQRQTKEVQEFLLRTSILGQTCGPLCDAILDEGGGKQSSQSMLRYLESSNLFLTALDDRGEWYRYHELFAEFLKHRLEESHPETIPVLHRRAAAWYKQKGSIGKAIDHALKAMDYPYAAELIKQIAETMLRRSEVVSLLHWIKELPERVVASEPSLCIYHAWALLLAGEPLSVIESWIHLSDQESKLKSGMEIALLAFVATFQGKITEAGDLSRKALEELPKDDQFLHNVLSWILALDIVWGNDNLGEGIGVLERIAEESYKSGNYMVAIMSLSNLAEMTMLKGKLGEAQEIYQRAISLAIDHTGRQLPITGMAMTGLGELLRRKNDIENAKYYLEEGLQLNKNWGEIGTADNYVSLALIKLGQGDPDGAQKDIEKALRIAESFDLTEVDNYVIDTYQVLIWLAQGKLENARAWAERRGLSVDAEAMTQEEYGFLGGAYTHAMEKMTLSKLLLAEGRYDDALLVTQHLMKTVEERGYGWLMIETQMQMAVIYQRMGKTEQALNFLHKTLQTTETDKPIRTYLDDGAPMREVLGVYVHQQCYPESSRSFARQILVAFEVENETRKSSKSEALSPSVWLSPRELEVLRLLATGCSNQEIAEKLFVATSTTKTHVKHIYDKLGVSKRTQAMKRARELGLLL
jgi:LuxR family maltose regulon positive regulatory protein